MPVEHNFCWQALECRIKQAQVDDPFGEQFNHVAQLFRPIIEKAFAPIIKGTKALGQGLL